MGRRGVTPAFLLILFLLFPPTVSTAETERILDFQSNVVILADASLEVTETIKVMALGKEIKRGIIREFPTKYRGALGGSIEVWFRIKKILRDGQIESYHTEKMSNGVKVYLGQSDFFLKPGEYTYTIVYETDGQLGYFQDYDELYWNVTGNGWTFAIDRARAVITLPPGGRVLKQAGYTGPQGAKGQDFSVTQSDGRIIFTTTKPLAPKEGLTVAVSWPKGLVYRPSAMENALKHYRTGLIGLGGLVIVFLYYLFFWFVVGKDPRKGTIIPLFEPPAKMSPAAVRFISRMGLDQKAATVALIDMAVKKYLTITEDDGDYTLHRTGKIATDLSPGEKKIAKHFFQGTDKIKLDKKNHRALSRGISEFREAIKKEYGQKFFMANRGYFLMGLLFSLGAMAAMILSSPDLETGGFISLWLSIWTFGVTFLVIVLIRAWKNVFSSGKEKGNIAAALLFTLFALPFIGGEIMGLVILTSVISLQGLFIAVLLAFLNILFFHLLKAPTRAGRVLLDQIDGFKKYLTVAEKDRINLLNPPEETPALFEKYLPYAMALDVEVQWGERFAGVLAAATAAGDGDYRPVWYSGASWDPGDVGGFTSSLGSSFSGSVSSSSVAPGSSSGSGGGGSSGGGGGGGGGSGW